MLDSQKFGKVPTRATCAVAAPMATLGPYKQSRFMMNSSKAIKFRQKFQSFLNINARNAIECYIINNN